MHKKLITIVCQLIAFACFGVAIGNFARLQSASDAPTLGALMLYVTLPTAFGLLAIAVHVYQVVIESVSTHGRPNPPPAAPESGAAPVPAKPLPDVGPTVVANDPPKNTEAENAKSRLHIWSIIDELSDALRDDPAGSDALHTVRERYHSIQFAPTDQESDEQPAQPTVKTKLAA